MIIDTYIITIPGDKTSEDAASRCQHSFYENNCEMLFNINTFRATTPETLEEDWKLTDWVYDVKWNWPTNELSNHIDKKTGLYKFAYTAADQRKKMACSMSHIRLWEKCINGTKPILILEHDAILTRSLSFDNFKDLDWGVVGINDPRGATRKSADFYRIATKNKEPGVYPVPNVNSLFDQPLPQGLAGHSAYFIRPFAAKEMIELVREHGIWPNDAQMCTELCPWLRISQPFYSTIQRTASSTVL